MTETLLRVSFGSKHGTICAGIVVINGRVRRAAPILKGLIGMKLEQVLLLIKSKGWYLG